MSANLPPEFAQHYYLSLLDPGTARLWATKGRLVSWRPGRMVLKADSPVEEVLFLFSGAIRLGLPGKGAESLLISFLRAPSVFGVAESIIQTRSTVKLTSVHESSGFLVPAPLFRDAWKRIPALARVVSRDVGWHLRLAQHQLRVAVLGDATARLAQLFLAYAALGVTPFTRGQRLTARLGQFALAEDLGLSRNAVRRALLNLKDHVSKEGGRFVIHDQRALLRFIGAPAGLYVPDTEYRYDE